jgi:hypothetical protein
MALSTNLWAKILDSLLVTFTFGEARSLFGAAFFVDEVLPPALPGSSDIKAPS